MNQFPVDKNIFATPKHVCKLFNAYHEEIGEIKGQCQSQEFVSSCRT
jgi:hypothetical protein